jgi:hypothetical protein
MADQVDVQVQDHGSVMVMTGLTGIAKAHLEDRMPDDVQMWGGGYVIDWRYIENIISDLVANDFTVVMI